MGKYKSYERTTSAVTVIHRNGSRYTAPVDILRSEEGRAEIMRHRSQQTISDRAERNGTVKTAASGDRKSDR